MVLIKIGKWGREFTFKGHGTARSRKSGRSNSTGQSSCVSSTVLRDCYKIIKQEIVFKNLILKKKIEKF